MKNVDVAKILNHIADILEFQDIPWKPLAYRKAAQVIESLTEDVEQIYHQGKLTEIPGIGESIAEKIEEMIQTGNLRYYEKLKKEVKVNLEELNQVPNLGPKRIKLLYTHLNIKDIADLEKAIEQRTLRKIPGFGEESEKKLLEGIHFVKTKPKRFLYAHAKPIVLDVLSLLKKLLFVKKVEVAGSFRRGKETVGDLDFLAVSSNSSEVMQAFVNLPDRQEILAQGGTKASIRLKNGLQIDLRVVREKEFGSAMNYFIGSKNHNIELRKLALRKGYTLSEYGLFSLKGNKWLAGRTEEEIYQKLGMQYIPPELRENSEEIELAQKNKLPKLITSKQVCGIFHNHSTWSDGSHSLLDMAQAAENMKFKFISFNDHCGAIGITNPITEKTLRKYLQEIEKVQKKVTIKVFSGLEIDILKDGALALPKNRLKELDVVIASVHMAIKMTEQEMTKRVSHCLENYPVHILGHPTDRLINERPPININLDNIFDIAKKTGTFLEINSQPARLDLAAEQVKFGKDAGCTFALSTDAHSTGGLKTVEYGVLQARRGWLEEKDLLNCWSISKIEKTLKKRF